MARTIAEIYDALITEKETMSSLNSLVPNPDTSQTFLSDLTSTSKVAIWRLFLWVVAFGIFVHEQIFDQHLTEVENKSDTLIVSTAKWLQAKCFEYQFGDQLEWLDNQFKYAVIDEDKKIIKRCAVVDLPTENKCRVKVATEDNLGNPIKLDTAPAVGELSGFSNYVKQILPVGTFVIVTSSNPDDVKIYAQITYDPLVIASDGSYLSDSAVFPAEDAINSYVGNLPFNGVFNLTKLVDAIQAKTGIKDAVINTTLTAAKYGVLPYTATGQNYTPDAGYMKIASAYPLSSTLTYVAG